MLKLFSKKIFSLVDLTNLKDERDPAAIATLCQQAVTKEGHAAAVCIYPYFVAQAKKLLQGTNIKIATVVNFPHGLDPLHCVIADIKHAIEQGANEIDVVFPYSQYLAGNHRDPFEFISQCKETCGPDILLKVILETGVLQKEDVITDVSRELCYAGADFLKTSTGKVAIGATLEAASLMLKEIKNQPRNVGLKISGGLRSFQDVMPYLELAAKEFGEEWITPAHFRIGTSQLTRLNIVRPVKSILHQDKFS